tara:strand:+ start:2874 stop:3332 length:459 start_codon:yes stop_codon:yes gene_type:complete
MAVVRSIQEYRKLTEKRIQALKRSGDRSSLAAAKHQVLQAKRLAPRATGVLRGNIRKRKLKSGKWQAESWVPGNFKYNLYVNRSPGYERLVYKKSNRRFGLKVGDVVIYGRSPAHWRWTGMSRYWDLAVNKTRRFFGRTARRNTQKALRITA